MSLKRLFGKFSKVEKQPDGTLYVEGIASSEAVDSDGEIIKSAAMAAALPDYMKYGALREMHQAIAAGKTLSATVDSDGVTHIAAKVVDPVAVKKVEEGVYQGFSIGGRVIKRDKNIIEELKLVEISLVDRPANPDAVISLFKADAVDEPAGGTVAAQDPGSATSTDDAAAKAAKDKADAEALAKAAADKKAADEQAKAAADKAAADASAKEAELAKAKQGAIACCEQMHKALSSAGFCSKDDAGDVDMAAQPGDVQKAADLEKRVAAAEEATKLAGEALQKLTAERDELTKAKTALEDELAKAKAELLRKGALKVVDKADETRTSKTDAPAPREGTPERALYEIKKSQASSGFRIA